MYNGVVNIYKEAGFTSHDVVAKLRGILKMKKIGHTGTLDPDAVGVLPVCLGNGTKVSDMLTDETKEYVAVLKLGIKTDTQDMSGEILSDNTDKISSLDRDEIIKTIMSFKGESFQIPPMYSALKVNGQKLYDLARKGIEVERKPRPVNIERIEILDDSENILSACGFSKECLKEEGVFLIRVVCSKGTYIRTLCNDIGEKLGVGGAMKHLIRSRVGVFSIDNAYTLSEIEKLVAEDEVESVITKVDVLFEKYPALFVKEEAMKALLNGNQLKTDAFTEDFHVMAGQGSGLHNVFRVYSSTGQFTGIYSYEKKYQLLTPVKMFL